MRNRDIFLPGLVGFALASIFQLSYPENAADTRHRLADQLVSVGMLARLLSK